MDDELVVLVAAYDNDTLVENQWGALRAMIDAGEVEVLDAAVIAREDAEHIGVVHNLHHPVRKGAIVGALLAVVAPVGLIAGAAAGALGGKASDIMRDGLDRKSLESLGGLVGAHPYAIVVAGRRAVVDAIGATMGEASRQVVHVVDTSAEALADAADDG